MTQKLVSLLSRVAVFLEGTIVHPETQKDTLRLWGEIVATIGELSAGAKKEPSIDLDKPLDKPVGTLWGVPFFCTEKLPTIFEAAGDGVTDDTAASQPAEPERPQTWRDRPPML